MAKQRIVNTKFWEDNYIIDLDPSEKLLFLYFITNDKTDLCWIYEINIKKISLETWFDKEMIYRIIERFSKDKKIYYIDWYIYIKNFSKHQNINPKIEAGIERSKKLIPNEIMAKISELDSLSIDYHSLSHLNSNFNLNSNLEDKSIDLYEQSSSEIEKIQDDKDCWNKDINEMQELIKNKVTSLWFIYKAGNQERNRIKNILTAKNFWELCEKIWMSREKFVESIIEISAKMEFAKRITNAEQLYKNYADVYNEALRLKRKKEVQKSETFNNLTSC